MKRLMALMGALALVAFTITPVHAADVAVRAKPKQLFWEQYGPSTAGNGTKIDTVFFDGAVQTVDTTEAVNTADFAFALANQANGATASGLLRFGIWCSGNGISCDSVFVACDTGPTSNGPWMTGTFVGGVAGASDDDWLSIMLLTDTDDNSAASTASKLYLSPWVRFRVRVDGNTAAKMSGARALLMAPYWRTD